MSASSIKSLAAFLLVTSLGSLALQGQALTVKSVGSVRHGADTQVTVVFSKPVEQTSATTLANYTFSGGVSVTGASLMAGLPPANAADILMNSAPNGRAFDNECVVLTVTGLSPGAKSTITVQNVKDQASPANTIATTNIPFQDSGYAWAESGTRRLRFESAS